MTLRLWDAVLKIAEDRLLVTEPRGSPVVVYSIVPGIPVAS
jgi:hypothetical protein